MGWAVRFVLLLVAGSILGSLCAGSGTGRPLLAALGLVAAICCLYFSFQRRQCPACGHVLLALGSASPYCMKCGAAYDGLKDPSDEAGLRETAESELPPGRSDHVSLDDNPYRAPREEPTALSKRKPPKLGIAFVCFAFAALFGFLFVSAMQIASRPLGKAVALGWTGATCTAFCAIAVGALAEKKWLMVGGALAILAALATMFTLAIGFSGR